MALTISRIPYSVRLELTNQCNLSCPQCLADAGNRAESEELSTEQWLKVIGELRRQKICDLSLTGGEVFTRKDILTLLRALCEGQWCRLTLLSNGTLLTDSLCLQLQQLGIRNIAISLDGLEQNNDAIRGRDSFQQAFSGIRNLVACRIIPSTSFTAMSSNIGDLAELIDCAYEAGVRIFRINTLQPEGRCQRVFARLAPRFPEDVADVTEVVHRKRAEYPEMRIYCNVGTYLNLFHLSPELFTKKPSPMFMERFLFGNCSAGKTSCEITSTGDVVPCSGLSDFVGGNILTDNFVEIWRYSTAFKTIRSAAETPIAEIGICGDCRYNELCDGGCRAASYLCYGDLYSPNPICPFIPCANAPEATKRKAIGGGL